MSMQSLPHFQPFPMGLLLKPHLRISLPLRCVYFCLLPAIILPLSPSPALFWLLLIVSLLAVAADTKGRGRSLACNKERVRVPSFQVLLLAAATIQAALITAFWGWRGERGGGSIWIGLFLHL